VFLGGAAREGQVTFGRRRAEISLKATIASFGAAYRQSGDPLIWARVRQEPPGLAPPSGPCAKGQASGFPDSLALAPTLRAGSRSGKEIGFNAFNLPP
jgi:hypothetical protein